MLFALFGALMIGLSLGLLGSGGSILTVPVLTYLVGQPEKVAIAGSLAIVGTISLFASIPHARRKQVDLRSVLFFGVPGMGGSYLGAFLSEFVSGAVQMTVFAALMLVAGTLMLRPLPQSSSHQIQRNVLMIALEGVIVGIVTGFVGVGGGFLIVPALVLLGGLPIHRAVGTSLLIIALNSLTGFVKHLDGLAQLDLHLDWHILFTFSSIGTVGSFAGSFAGRKLPQQTLRKTFAYFLFAIGAMILLKSSSSI